MDEIAKQLRYNDFIMGLTLLTQQYGVAIQSIGGVTVSDNPEDFRELNYRADRSSHDLIPLWSDE
jgi:hypothetical protein